MNLAEKVLRAKADLDAAYEAGKAASGGVKTCSIEFYEYIGCFNKVILTCVEDGAIVEKVFDGVPQDGIVGNVLAGSIIVTIISDDYYTENMDDVFKSTLTPTDEVVVSDDPDVAYVMYVTTAPSNPVDNYDYAFHI